MPGDTTGLLLSRLTALETRVQAAVARRRATDPDPDDGFRGLYLADHHVDALLAGAVPLLVDDPSADQAVTPVADDRLVALVGAASLTRLDVDLLVAAAAPDYDARFEKLYGYLHDDVTVRRATVGLALELAGSPGTNARGRARLGPSGPLVRLGLVVVRGDGPVLRRTLQVPDRVLEHLLGNDDPAEELLDLLDDAPAAASPEAGALARVMGAEVRLAYVHAVPGSDGVGLAVAALAASARGAVVVDLNRLDTATPTAPVAAVAAREALLTGCGLVVGPLEVLERRGDAHVRVFADLPCPTVVVGATTWDPLWTRQVAVLVEAPVADVAARELAWAAVVADVDPVEATRGFRLGPRQVVRAATAARQQAELAGRPVGRAELLVGARAQNAVGLERLARRIVPAVGWHDLVLAAPVEAQLRDLAARARRREQVLDDWGMRPGGGRGRGVTALFAGDSGTGKTLASEVLAAELGLDLYAVDLATVVDKYIGETEKNLERIFSEAEGVNGVLLFDEADALFGKRSEVKDSRDRYANLEVAYLLQRMESFNGLALLATNLRTNLDEAFARRLDAIVDFPLPDVGARHLLWQRCLGPAVPREPDVTTASLLALAETYDLPGGNIRSITLGAAYAAAELGTGVTTALLVTAVEMEFRKLGRLVPSPPSVPSRVVAGAARWQRSG